MQNWDPKIKFVGSLLVFSIISFSVLLVTGCGKNIQRGRMPVNSVIKETSESNGSVSYVKFRPFQNSDSTWGFTVFVDSKPYLQYRKIPFPKASSGFRSKNDAEKVGTLFVRTIEKGDLTPDLNEKQLDSLEILLN